MIRAFIQQIHRNSGKMVLQALVPFSQLTRCAVFTQRNDEQPSTDEEIMQSNTYYQRRMNPKRLKEIQQYIYQAICDEQLNETIATLFPSSMILAMEYDENILKEKDGVCSFELPEKVFVVDGQHRLMAMKQLYVNLRNVKSKITPETIDVIKYLDEYKFSCSILVNYDLWEQGQVFANVNFKQKPVNRSLYYDIYGSEYRENEQDWKRNNIYLAHHLVRFMNEDPTSPYHGHIKMLGTGKGYVSQAFFVEAIMRHFRNGGIWWYNADAPDFSDRTYEYMAVELLTYYHVIEKLFSDYWPKTNELGGTLICKTTGTGAFVRLLSDMREKGDEDLLRALRDTQVGRICEPYGKQVEMRLQPVAAIAEDLFGKESKYGGTGGKGLEAALYKKMREVIVEAHLIEEEPVPKISSDERIAAIEWARHSKIVGQLYKLGIRNVENELDKYLTTNVIDDLELNCHHYFYHRFDFLRYISYRESDEGVLLEGKMSILIDTYLDAEEEIKIPMRIPCTFKFVMKKEGNGWKGEENGIFVETNVLP